MLFFFFLLLAKRKTALTLTELQMWIPGVESSETVGLSENAASEEVLKL